MTSVTWEGKVCNRLKPERRSRITHRNKCRSMLRVPHHWTDKQRLCVQRKCFSRGPIYVLGIAKHFELKSGYHIKEHILQGQGPTAEATHFSGINVRGLNAGTASATSTKRVKPVFRYSKLHLFYQLCLSCTPTGCHHRFYCSTS